MLKLTMRQSAGLRLLLRGISFSLTAPWRCIRRDMRPHHSPWRLQPNKRDPRWSELGIGVNVGEPAPYYADRCRAWLDIPARVPAAPRVSHRPLGRRCSTYWFQSFRRHLTNPNRPASTTQFGTATNHEGTRISDHDKPGWSRTAAGHHSPRWALRDQVDSSVCAAMRLRASERGNVESVIALPTVCKLTSFRMAFHNPGYEVGLTRRAGLDN